MKYAYAAVVISGLLVTGCDDPDVVDGIDFGHLLTRTEYMEMTGCKVSPASYEKLRETYGLLSVTEGDPNGAAVPMAAFLEDVYAGRPGPDGFLDERCLPPGMRRIAGDLGLLDAEGRYASTD